MSAAERFPGSRFITKHNRAGNGLGVRLFDDADALAGHLASGDFVPSVDGITLVQEYGEAPEPCITRVEFIGREFLYAARVDTSEGFELCPADVCQTGADATAEPKFQVIGNFDPPLLNAYRRLLEANDIHVAAFELIVDGRNVAYTYDVNTNTNYNPEAEIAAGIFGMERLAAYLGRELAALENSPIAA